MSLEGKIQVQADIVPTNDNPKMSVTDIQYIKGGPQVFQTIDELAAHHPNRMKAGMPSTVMNWPEVGTITDFRLSADPLQMVDSSGNSLVTVDNFEQYWTVQSSTISKNVRVYQYAPDGPGGGQPIFPYTEEEESKWSNTRDDSKGHKWMRFRDDDVDVNSDGIFDNWSVPIPISGIFQTGDYTESRFKRQAVSDTVHTDTSTMTADKYYVVQAGSVQITGDLSLNEIGHIGIGTVAVMAVGRTFKFAAANAYVFQSSGSVVETLQPPPRTINGLPNNEPVGWVDTIPAGSNQLWEIVGQKSVYGQLKSDWILKRVVENPNYIRYSNNPSPHPDTIAGVNTPAGTGTPEDTALEAAGWSKTYSGQSFIATREDDPGPNLFTNWLVRKINEESGEYTDRVFKLFDINLDLDDPSLVPPSNRDASVDGWSDTPLQETATQINYISEARKFFNGELKTPWSDPVPYTGKDSYLDVIDAAPADNFKYDDVGAVTPTELTLTSRLFKGLLDLSEDANVTISYTWTRVFNGGSVDNTVAGSNSADPFYFLGATGSPAPGEYRNGQRLVVKPEGVDGQAVFRCVQTITMAQGDDLVFTHEISIADVSDGKDAKSFVVTADNDRTIYDSTGSVFVPAQIVMRAYWSNINTPTLHWYRKITGVWTAITNGATYTIGGNTCAFNASALFAADGTAEELQFAVSTHATDPDGADQLTTFSDYITIVKLSSAGVGSPGENSVLALLANEAHTVVLDSATVAPVSGEIGGDGKARTRVELFDGLTRKTYGTDYTIVLASDNANVSFAQRFFDADGSGPGLPSTTDAEIYVSGWTNQARSAKCTLTITYGSRTIVKEFSVASTLDAPGAIILDVDSDRGFIFSPTDATAKTLLARLFDTSMTGGQNQIIRATQATIADFAAASGGYAFVERAHIVLTGSAGPIHLVYRYNGGTKTSTGSYTALGASEYYTFRWNVNSVWSALSTDNRRVINRSDILAIANVTVEAYQNSILKRTRTVAIADVSDGKIFRAWTANVTKPTASEDLSNQDPTNSGIWPVTVSGVVWRLPTDAFWTSNLPTYAQDAEESGGIYTWGAVYQLKGEKGDQGTTGNFFHTMYRSLVPANSQNPSDPAYTTPPDYGAGGTSSTLVQMISAGWVSQLPTSGVIWETKRLWTGQGVAFNGAGDPSTSPVVGSTWSPRVRISGKDGQNIPGDPGAKGWSPNLAVLAGLSETKIMRLIDWIGGTGSKPGNIGDYLGQSGFTSDISQAFNIAGDAVELRYDVGSGYLQWKYVPESAGAWRNLIQVAVRFANRGFIAGAGVNFSFASQLNVTLNRSLSGSSWNNNTGADVTVKITAMTLAMRDSGGSDGVDFTVESSISGSPDSTTCRFPLDGNSWTTLVVSTYRNVPAGQTISWSAAIASTTGSQCYMQPVAKFDVEIVG
jgi:hypothetical protein